VCEDDGLTYITVCGEEIPWPTAPALRRRAT